MSAVLLAQLIVRRLRQRSRRFAGAELAVALRDERALTSVLVELLEEGKLAEPAAEHEATEGEGE